MFRTTAIGRRPIDPWPGVAGRAVGDLTPVGRPQGTGIVAYCSQARQRSRRAVVDPDMTARFIVYLDRHLATVR